MKRIVIIEDDDLIAEMLKALLVDQGYLVTLAFDGRAGLEAVRAYRPDLVLCDILLPYLDGREVRRSMQADPDLRSIPVVLMSCGRRPDPSECPAPFLAKPFRLAEVLALINEHIGAGDQRLA